MPRSRYKIWNHHLPHFMTATINHWLPVFTRPETVNIILDYWRFLQKDTDFKIYGYVILENHLHLVAGSPNLSHDIQRFKSFTAREIVSCLNTNGAGNLLYLLEHLKRPNKTRSTHQVWEEGTHPQVIENEQILLQKLDYIHQNPVKRGYVDTPEHWRYSSARNYSGLEGLIDVCTDW